MRPGAVVTVGGAVRRAPGDVDARGEIDARGDVDARGEVVVVAAVVGGTVDVGVTPTGTVVTGRRSS
ncbi:MAG: hypothetical protein JST64_01400 [Actinobacteria bacterium]|nr:hypothetical protein [Actinomycetota bacterium]